MGEGLGDGEAAGHQRGFQDWAGAAGRRPWPPPAPSWPQPPGPCHYPAARFLPLRPPGPRQEGAQLKHMLHPHPTPPPAGGTASGRSDLQAARVPWASVSGHWLCPGVLGLAQPGSPCGGGATGSRPVPPPTCGRSPAPQRPPAAAPILRCGVVPPSPVQDPPGPVGAADHGAHGLWAGPRQPPPSPLLTRTDWRLQGPPQQWWPHQGRPALCTCRRGL